MKNFHEDLTTYQPKANINVFREDTGEVLFRGHNVIVNVSKWLFARLMANVIPNAPNPPYTLGQVTVPTEYADPQYGIWGLALGAGDPSWAPETQPDPSPTQTALIAEFLRVPLSRVNFVDSNNNPLATLSTMVQFQITVNATTNNITQPIREMGLIGGGTISTSPVTNMMTAPYFNPAANPPGPANSVVLINYKTLPPLLLPPGVNIIFSWVLSF
jgi:hypothetical protein